MLLNSIRSATSAYAHFRATFPAVHTRARIHARFLVVISDAEMSALRFPGRGLCSTHLCSKNGGSLLHSLTLSQVACDVDDQVFYIDPDSPASFLNLYFKKASRRHFPHKSALPTRDHAFKTGTTARIGCFSWHCLTATENL